MASACAGVARGPPWDLVRALCYDNALCEPFFATLQCKLIERETSLIRSEARLNTD